MSFLDSLEDNLKALESREERSQADTRKRDADRAAALAAAPWAEKLKLSGFTRDLLTQANRAGHGLRAKVYLAWIGTTLRLELRERRLELRPTPGGVVSVFLDGNSEIEKRPVDLDGDAGELVRSWLADLAQPGS